MAAESHRTACNQGERAAFVLEPRNFGESSLEALEPAVRNQPKIALLNGRTALGERVWDVMRELM